MKKLGASQAAHATAAATKPVYPSGRGLTSGRNFVTAITVLILAGNVFLCSASKSADDQFCGFKAFRLWR